MDITTTVTGVTMPRGQRIAVIRQLDGAWSTTVYELYQILGNGDWLDCGMGDATEAMRWLAGLD